MGLGVSVFNFFRTVSSLVKVVTSVYTSTGIHIFPNASDFSIRGNEMRVKWHLIPAFLTVPEVKPFIVGHAALL